MRKYYSEPILELRKYIITNDIFTDSNPEEGSSGSENDLENGDDYDIFGN